MASSRAKLPCVCKEMDDTGTQVWRDKITKQLHQNHDLPAIICANGHQEWYFQGRLHRDHDQPAVIWLHGSQEWFYHGQRHRDNDQPALLLAADGTQAWYFQGQLHRHHARPAVIWGHGGQEWWFEGYRITQTQAQWIAQRRKVAQDKAIRLFKYTWFLPRLYDPTTASGQRRLNASWAEVELLMSERDKINK